MIISTISGNFFFNNLGGLFGLCCGYLFSKFLHRYKWYTVIFSEFIATRKIIQDMSLVIDARTFFNLCIWLSYNEISEHEKHMSILKPDIPLSLNTIHSFERKEVIRDKVVQIVEKLRTIKLEKAAPKIKDGIKETLTYMDFPTQHWTWIRINNTIEHFNREIKRK